MPARFFVAIVIFLAPVLIGLVLFTRRTRRLRREAEAAALPFEPKPEPAAGVVLRHFAAPQGAYLRAHWKTLPWVVLYGAWIFGFLLSLPIFNAFPHAGLWTDRSTMYWYTFLQNATRGPQFQGTMIFAAAFVTLIPLRAGSPAVFYRTRPLPLGFLFWTRVVSTMGVLGLSVVLAIGLALGLLYVAHGPVWQHLPAAIPRVLGADDADMAETYAALLVTSVPRIFLSLLTTTFLYAGVAVLAASLPLGGVGLAARQRSLFTMAFASLIPSVLGLILSFNDVRMPGWMFFYTEFGPPPAYGYALVPLGIAAVCLLVARRLIARVEV